MPIESSVTKPSDLNASYPEDGDLKAIGPQHFRNLKTSLKYFQTSAGATEVNTIRSETGGTSRTLQAKLRELPSPEDFGVTGDGTTDDTVNFQKALDIAKRVRLTPGATYKITASIVVPTNGGIIGDGSQTIYMAASGFTNTAIVSTGSTCVGIDCNGGLSGGYTVKTNVLLQGFKVQCEVGDSRYLIGIAARNINGLKIKDVELYGFPLGRIVQLDSVNGDSELNNVYIHDCTTAVDWSAITSSPQLTGIAIDGSRVNSVASTSGLRIINPRIEDLTFTGTALTTHGYQTDGINIEHNSARKVQIINPYIDTVGDGIDIFGEDCQVVGGALVDCYNNGVKLIHGASNNTVTGTRITRPGTSGVVFASVVGGTNGHIENNLITGVTVERVNPDAVASTSNAAAFLFLLNGTPDWTPNNNRVIGCKVLGKSDVAISSITRSGTTATLTTSAVHGLSTNDRVSVFGAAPAAYNVSSAVVTVTSTTEFTYVMASDPGSSATTVGAFGHCHKMGHVVSHQCGFGNIVDGIEAPHGFQTAFDSIPAASTSKARTANKTSVRAYLGSNTALAASATATLTLDTEEIDTNNEFASNTYTAKGSKRLLVRGSMRLTASSADEQFTIMIRKGATIVAESTIVSPGGELTISVSDVVGVVAADTIDIRVQNHSITERTMSGLSRFTFVSIEEI